jgi:4-amino-4-deoxy-L-arabinose transferase-like glycosyltransferase
MPKIPFWIFILLAVLHISAVRVGVMDIDASQYAEISREMANTGSYLQLFDRGVDYLDKPPFLFWISATGMKVFGVGDFGFKLPSILFALFAIYATYRLARLLYGEATGRLAALIFGTCQGLFLMTNDIRTDTVLMSWVIIAVWLIKEWDTHRKLHHLLLGFAAIAFGMMSKGPIALLVPVFCFASDWALKREWKKFFRWEYLLGTVVMAILLIPMSIGLYQQFDAQPEKVVNGLTGVSGLRFFYWSQSFGRITGESPWNNGAGFDFLLSNMLWSFLPWIFLFLPALIVNIIILVKQKFRLHPSQEWITMGGFILSYIALGSSKYQLPHYIFVAFPLAAITTAAFLKMIYEEHRYRRLFKVLRPLQWIIATGMMVAALLLVTIVFPSYSAWLIVWAVAALVWIAIALRKGNYKIITMSVVSAIIANIVLTHHFYYNLMNYQAGNQMAKYIRDENIPAKDIIIYRNVDPLNAFHFYAEAAISRDSMAIAPGKYVWTQKDGLAALQQKGYAYDMIQRGRSFRISELKPQFLNAVTRQRSLQDYYFIRIK